MMPKRVFQVRKLINHPRDDVLSANTKIVKAILIGSTSIGRTRRISRGGDPGIPRPGRAGQSEGQQLPRRLGRSKVGKEKERKGDVDG